MTKIKIKIHLIYLDGIPGHTDGECSDKKIHTFCFFLIGKALILFLNVYYSEDLQRVSVWCGKPSVAWIEKL